MTKFSQRLKELRLEKQLTQQTVAIKTGLSQVSITNWENGKRIPNAEAVIVLAKFFDVTVGQLLGTEDL